MADQIEMEEVASTSANHQGQEIEENGFPAPTPVDLSQLYPEDRCRSMVQTYVNGPWLDFMANGLLLVMVLIQLWENPCETESLFKMVNGVEASVYFFFLMEMVLKVWAAQGFWRQGGGYLRDNWNKVDVVILVTETVDFILRLSGINWRFSRPMTPIRMLSRDKSLRKLVLVILKMLPVVMNYCFLFVFILFTFSIVGVQLWAGQLRNRCFLGENVSSMYNVSLSPYYVSEFGESDPFICSAYASGSHRCMDVPPLRENRQVCLLNPRDLPVNFTSQTAGRMNHSDCVNWNTFYNVCRPDGPNPYMEAISFDNVGFGWITVFQVVTLESWTDIMYYVMDASNYWSFLFFVLVTGLGYFLILNTCTVIIATYFSESMEEYHEEENQILVLLRNVWRKITDCVMELWSSSNLRQTEGSQIRQPERENKLRDFVEGPFKQFMIGTIIFNVMAMCVEYHDQPDMMTQILYYCNIIFTVLFVIELLLSLLAYRLSYFVKWENIFDFVIVIISLWELGSNSSSKLSALRSFRVLRLVKLFHFLPYLKRQMLVLKWTMTKAASLCHLVLFFIYVFSLLGMNLFSCQFVPERGNIIDDRKNFDSLLWAEVSIFQVLTQGTWNFVMYNAMASTSPVAALYFVVIIMFGKNILLNILVAIVVKGFQSQPNVAADPSANANSVTAPENDAETNEADSNQADRNQADTDIVIPEEDAEQTNSTLHNRFQRRIQAVMGWCRDRQDWSFFLLSPDNKFRSLCHGFVTHNWFYITIMTFIALSCIAVAFERPAIQPESTERLVLDIFSYIFTSVFTVEILIKVIALGVVIGEGAYFRCLWNLLDGLLAVVSFIDMMIFLLGSTKVSILSILKVWRLLRVFRPLRMMNQTPRLKLAVETLITSIKPTANILVICGLYLLIFAILGVQMFKGKFSYCVGEDLSNVITKMDCLAAGYQWVLKEYNFNNLLEAFMSLFVMFSKDGWIYIMYDGLDGVGVDQQPVKNYNLWMLAYFLSFMVLSLFLLNMFIGVMVETFYQCQQKQNAALPPPQTPVQNNGAHGRFVWLDVILTAIILMNMVLMCLERYNQPETMTRLLDYSVIGFTIILFIEVALNIFAFGPAIFFKDGWNLLDILIITTSTISVVLTEIQMPEIIPFNTTILRIVRVLQLTHVLKVKTIKTLLLTILKTVKQIGNVGLLLGFFLFMYAVLGVELFGKLDCSVDNPCVGLHRYSNFQHFFLALLTLYKICTCDNWSGILKDAMRPCRPGDSTCWSGNTWVAPIYFFSFVVLAQFVLVNLIVASIMQALEESRQEVQTALQPETPRTQEEGAENPLPSVDGCI